MDTLAFQVTVKHLSSQLLPSSSRVKRTQRARTERKEIASPKTVEVSVMGWVNQLNYCEYHIIGSTLDCTYSTKDKLGSLRVWDWRGCPTFHTFYQL